MAMDKRQPKHMAPVEHSPLRHTGRGPDFRSFLQEARRELSELPSPGSQARRDARRKIVAFWRLLDSTDLLYLDHQINYAEREEYYREAFVWVYGSARTRYLGVVPTRVRPNKPKYLET